MKYYLVVNPVSGNRNGMKKALVVKKLLKKYGIESKIIQSRYKGNIEEEVKKLSLKHKCRFYSIGGDGTLNDIVNGIIGTDSQIVVLPAGTGNDFSRSISDYSSIRTIVKKSLENDVRKVDVIKIDTMNKYSINILNSGFDATVAYNMNKFRKIPFVGGTFKYNLAIFYTLFRNKNYMFKIRVDGRVYKGKYTLVAIANGKYYGGGVCPAPTANLNDGNLKVCIVKKTSFFEKLVLLPKYKKSKHLGLKQVIMEEGKNISIVSNQKFQMSIDGEIHETRKLKCNVQKQKVNIVFTKK